MRQVLGVSAILAGGFWLAGCVSPATPPTEAARDALIRYFDLLHNGRYQEAADLYGGSYDSLISSNPELDPSDFAALLLAGCTRNGLQCLEVLEATPTEASEQGHFTFDVQFRNDDGSKFVRGPCCGASETEQPPQDVFQISVEIDAEGEFVVMDLPVYVP